MHTEHLQNVRPILLLTGWLTAVAVTSLIALAMVSFGVASSVEPSTPAEVFWALTAVAVGFFVGGFLAGFRSLHAPVLLGVGIGIMSLVAWFVLNILAVLLAADADWQGLPPAVSAGLLLGQMLFAVAGAWLGYRMALRDQPEPEDLNPPLAATRLARAGSSVGRAGAF